MRLDWNPVLPLTAIFFGLLLVLLEPDGQEPLNQGKEKLTIIQFITDLDAGNMILKDREEYNRISRKCASGLIYDGIKYDNIFLNKSAE